MSKIDEKASDVKHFRTDYIQRQLDFYDGLEPEKQKELFEVALEEIERLRKKYWGRGERIENLKLRFNREMLSRYPEVVTKYAQEIMIWEMILHEAMAQGRRRAKKQGRKEFEFLYETDGKQFAKAFSVSYYKALQVMKRLERMGAWETIDRRRDRCCVFYLGERWANDAGYPVNFVLFRLRNPNTKAFFDKEQERIK